jgi:uncharacterized protein (DUF58 family)
MNLTPLSYWIIALICVMGIVHQWGDPQMFPWWRLAMATFVAGLLYEWLRVRSARIGVAAQQVGTWRLGRSAEAALMFDNGDDTPAVVQFAPALPSELDTARASREIQLTGQSRQSVRLPVRPLQLGKFPWRYLPLRIKGPLRLGWWSSTKPLDAELTVIPDMLVATGRASGSQQTGLARQQRPGTGQELHHLREYRQGDPRHTIDWKATARTGDLVTRVYGEDQHLEIMLILDTGRTSRTNIDGLSQLGHYVNLAARFAEHAIAHEDRIGLIAVADRPVAIVPPTRGARAIRQLRHVLGTLTTEAVECDPLTAAVELARLVRHRCLIIVLTDLYGNSASGRLMQSVRHWVPKHLPMIVGLVGRELKTMADAPAVDWLDPYTSLAARTYRQDLRRGSESLQRVGAHTLIARPRDLEKQVLAHYQMLKAQRRI